VSGHNANSLGICLLGREEFTKDQYASLEQVLKSLLIKYPGAEILGHRDLDDKKTCPNFDVRGWWEGVTGNAKAQ
jgi:N-acetyl-anhydromuramyl-L-alanine amidase AmpD